MVKYRQGDVMLREVREFPKKHYELKKQKDGVLKEGEVTGHFHKFKEEDVEKVQVLVDDKGNKYVDVKEDNTELIHPEHKTIPVKKGRYEVSYVQYYDYESKMFKPVQD